jgi:uncharacterized protein (AIM24 family)
MAWMNDQVRMDTHAGGSFLAGLARSFGGGSFSNPKLRQAQPRTRKSPTSRRLGNLVTCG